MSGSNRWSRMCHHRSNRMSSHLLNCGVNPHEYRNARHPAVQHLCEGGHPLTCSVFRSKETAVVEDTTDRAIPPMVARVYAWERILTLDNPAD